jgi:hypothetical protein
MSDSDRPRSPFAGMTDFSTRPPVRVLSPDQIEQMLAEHQLYLETEYHQGHRANFASADLTKRDFSGVNLRGIKMDRAVLRGADFTGAQLQGATLIGVISEEARFDRSDLSGARLSGANLVWASLEGGTRWRPRRRPSGWSSISELCSAHRYSELAIGLPR